MIRKVFTFLFLLVGLVLGYGQSNILNANNPTEIGKKNIDQIQSDLDSYLEYLSLIHI